MTLAIGEPVRLYIQLGDGELHEVTGRVSQLSTYMHSSMLPQALDERFPMPIPSHTETNITVIGDHYLKWGEKEFAEKLETIRTSLEWRCDHCETVNLREHRKCDECGFPRPFLYGI